MTSFAFILGVFPMVVSSGAGANARHAIGTGVVGGMLSAAVLGVLLIPVCYVAVRRLLGDKLDEPGQAAPGAQQRRRDRRRSGARAECQDRNSASASPRATPSS